MISTVDAVQDSRRGIKGKGIIMYNGPSRISKWNDDFVTSYDVKDQTDPIMTNILNDICRPATCLC